MEFLFTRIMSRLLVGLFLGVSAETYFRKTGRIRKWLFRFGGESPFSWGQKRKWLFWYFGALFVELMAKLSLSFFFGIVPSLDFLLSPVQALLLTTGLWITDRAVMIFEPENRWKEGSAAELVKKEVQKSEEKSWIREKITQTAETADPARELTQGIESSTHIEPPGDPAASHKTFSNEVSTDAEVLKENEVTLKEEQERLKKRHADLTEGR